MRKRIACLGWGSLLWAPKDLPIRSEWFEHGPLLPIEFARLSSGDRVTLVITPGARAIPALWALLEVPSVGAGQRRLKEREGTRREMIGCWPHEGDSPTAPDLVSAIADWAVPNGLDGVVWSAMPPKWDGQNGVVPSIEQVLDLLRAAASPDAEEYVRRTPPSIRTAYRDRIEAQLGWTPRAS